MSAVTAVAKEVDAAVEAYVAAWNETDSARRRAAIERACDDDTTFRDPLMKSEGRNGLDALLAGVQARFPGFVLKRTSPVDSHNDAVRFAWSLGPADGPSVVEGVDFATVGKNGKLAAIVGFIDKMPG